MSIGNADSGLEASRVAWRPAIARRYSVPVFVGTATPANKVLFGLAFFLFLVPNLLLSLGFGTPAAAFVAAGCALAFHVMIGGVSGPLLTETIDKRLLARCGALAFALTILGGQGHIFFTNFDWLVRDAVLADLSRYGLSIRYHHDQQDWFLRAPLGMYMLPAAAGRAFGLSAAHLSMVVQNAALLTTLLYFITLVSQTRSWIFTIGFVLFGGLDIVPIAFWKVIQTIQLGHFVPSDTIEWWTQAYRGETDVMLQYPSHVTQLFWAPNHTLAGWWFALLYLLAQRKEVDLPVVGVSFVPLLAWSPLAMIGALPFLLLCAVGQLPKALLSPRLPEAIAACVCFVPILLYLMIDAGTVPHRWLLPIEGFLGLQILFLAVEIPHVAFLAALREKIAAADRGGLLVAVIALVLIPTFSVGDYNDFALRVSIVPLCLLGSSFAQILAAEPRPRGKLWVSIVMLAVLGAIPPLLEFRRALHLPAYKVSDCNLLTSWRRSLPNSPPANYLARANAFPVWLAGSSERTLLETEPRKCWPDHPLLAEDMR